MNCGLEAMVAWTWSELAVNGFKDSPKKEAEILIKMFHIIMSCGSLLFDKNADEWEILYRHSLPVLNLRYAIDSRKLPKKLGWEPSLLFEESIEETVKWYLENQECIDHVTSGEYQKYYEGMYC